MARELAEDLTWDPVLQQDELGRSGKHEKLFGRAELIYLAQRAGPELNHCVPLG